MGAQVSKTFNKQVTHVVFNNGHAATWKKAKKSHVKLVSVLWIGKCHDDAVLVDEELYPAVIDESNLVLRNKQHRCMQPRDCPERTPENDRRMKKKLDKLMKDIAPKQTMVTDDSPFVIDEDSGIVYSPACKRTDYMAERLKHMKEKRENISPTESDVTEQNSPDKPFSKDLAKPWLSPCRDISKRPSFSPLTCPDFTINEVEGKTPEKQRMTSGTKSLIEKPKSSVRTLVMTSMPTQKQNTVVQVVKALGGFSIVDRVCESTTHVVSGEHRRTLNVLLGIARGCWILSFEWIVWCLEQRQWVPEEPYELSEQFPAAQICRLQKHLSFGDHYQQDLFQDQPPMFVSQHSQPPAPSLVELIQLCGGRVCNSVRQAGICIGRYSGRRPVGSRILSEQWVLDSITNLKNLSYDNYDLV
uniref:Microcephalin 1 n=1 Tax=Hippocampus comes TaxID=109280 RepID=A0A3Q3DI73_HIPCM